MTRAPDEPETERVLISLKTPDLEVLDRLAKRMRTSRSRLVVIAVYHYANTNPGCPICGKTEDHVH